MRKINGWSCLKTSPEKRILTSLAVLLQLNRYFGLVYRHWKLAGSLRLKFNLQKLDSHNGRNDDDQKLPVMRNTLEWVPKSFRKNLSYIVCITRRLREVELIASFWMVLNECVLCYAKEASLAMYYWATDFKADLTHGSKSEALAPDSSFKTWFVDVRISSC